MKYRDLNSETLSAIEQVLGYLNFSSGSTDPNFFLNLDLIYRAILAKAPSTSSASRASSSQRSPESPQDNDDALWKTAIGLFTEHLNVLASDNPTFANSSQASSVLKLVGEQLIPGYRSFHRDLLFHQSDDQLFGPFMLGRIFEVALRQEKPFDNLKLVVKQAVSDLNCFIGHRPVPPLESQKIEPRAHEWVRPVPLYVEQAGVAVGVYHDLIELTIEMLKNLDEDLARAAYFDPSALEELAFDPRAYDFDHPVNRRPSYHFGEWDPHYIDNKGRYRRFVVRQVNLEALLQRVEEISSSALGTACPPREELMWEAAVVLTGTILMASGVSGGGPDTHDSNTTLSTIVTRFAAYRDAFYERVIQRLEGPRLERLRREQERQQQPFGGARQHLNSVLSQRLARQLEHVKLANVFARMGYVDAAQLQVDAVPVASARMMCRIDCAITAGRQALNREDPTAALTELDQVVDLLHRGISCGAIVDPWNILGFDANFSLFPALENSVRDHRIDELITKVERIGDLFARAWSDAAAANDAETAAQVESRYDAFTEWWHKFAAHEVASTNATAARLEFDAAQQVAGALNSWHREGAATGDVKFWAPFVEDFDSPKAYALVIATLLGKGDFVSSMSLLIHWLSQHEKVGFGHGTGSFYRLANQWIRAVIRAGFRQKSTEESEHQLEVAEAWKLLYRFFDFLEANAEDLWQPPVFQGANEQRKSQDLFDDVDADSDDDDLFHAAYEDVVYQDSTDDGNEGSVFENAPRTDEELRLESKRVAERLEFLSTVAEMWTAASVAAESVSLSQLTDNSQHATTTFEAWWRQSRKNRIRLLELIDAISSESIPKPAGHQESMIDYDRYRQVIASLVEKTIVTTVEMSQAERFLLALVQIHGTQPPFESTEQRSIDDELTLSAKMIAAGILRDRQTASLVGEQLLQDLPDKQILYVPQSKGGCAKSIAIVRIRQRIIENSLVVLPRLGLLATTQQLINTARKMELNELEGRAAVTQFDELFEVGFRELVSCCVRATDPDDNEDDFDADQELIGFLEQLTEAILRTWLEHSHTLRLSALERVLDEDSWQSLVEFIQDYGDDLFTQRFLNLSNLRAILHCGVDSWLTQLQESGIEAPFRLLNELDVSVPRAKAVRNLTLIFNAIVESFNQYQDYNLTTTQSDQGEKLYTLLDFLRLQATYDRIAWNLKPVIIAHEIIVRAGRNEAAQLWRRALADRVGEEAQNYQKKLSELQQRHAMKMASVANRIAERFTRPMTVDRMRATVAPAIQQLNETGPTHAFDLLEEETAMLMREPAGSGFGVPPWLSALEQEVDRIRPWSASNVERDEDEKMLEPYNLSMSELQEQLDDLD